MQAVVKQNHMMDKKDHNRSKCDENDTLRYMLDIIREGVWDWNSNTGYVERSPSWYRMLEYDIGSFPETVFTWENIIHPDDYREVMNHFDDYIHGLIDYYEIEYRARKSDDTYLWIRDQGKVVERNSDGSVARMIGAHLNINEQKLAQIALQYRNELLSKDKLTLENLVQQRNIELEEANRRLEENLKRIHILSIKDPLTGICNRRKSEQDLQQEIERANRYKHPLSVALFDIDNFKGINDSYGHHTGDEVLKLISKLTREHIRSIDQLSRWGGDEYFIILPEINIINAAQTIEKIRKIISETDFIKSIKATCSFGITQYIQGDSIESMYKRVDIGLYRAKSAGRNTAVTF